MGKVTRCKRQDRKKRVLSCFQFYCKTFIITMFSNYSSLEFNLTKYKSIIARPVLLSNISLLRNLDQEKVTR